MQLHFDLTDTLQAVDACAASYGKRKRRIDTSSHDSEDVLERARLGLRSILMAIEERPRSARAKRLVRILAGIYECNEIHLDTNDLRVLNAGLAAACIDCFKFRVLRSVAPGSLP
jgi:hypothetical protein